MTTSTPSIAHSALAPADGIHAPHSWAVADEAQRLALAVTSDDIGKTARQGVGALMTEWMLVAVGPAVWKERGAKGQPGEDGVGIQGDPGLSAYQVAVAGGYVDNAAAWLASLQGSQGKSAYQVAVDGGYSGSAAAWIASLKGGKGDDGLSAYAVAVANGFVGSQTAWLASLKGADGAAGNAAPISITGTPLVGSTLSIAIAAGWQNSGGNWTRNGTAISGATNPTYNTVSADVPGPVTYKSSSIPYIPPGLTIAAAPVVPSISAAPVLSAVTAGGAINFTAGTFVGTPTYSLMRGTTVLAASITSGQVVAGPVADDQVFVRLVASSAGQTPAQADSNTVVVSAVAPAVPGPVRNLVITGASDDTQMNYAFDAPNTGVAPTSYSHYIREVGATTWAGPLDFNQANMVGSGVFAGSKPAGGLSRGKSYEYGVAASSAGGAGPTTIVPFIPPQMTLTAPVITSDPFAGVNVTWTEGTAVSTTGGPAPTKVHRVWKNGAEVVGATNGSVSRAKGDIIAVVMDATDSTGTARAVTGQDTYAAGTPIFTETDFDGVVLKRARPASSKLTPGSQWYAFPQITSGAMTALNYTGPAGISGIPLYDAASKLMVTHVSGFPRAQWALPNVTPPADKMLQVVIYIKDWATIPTVSVVNGLDIVIGGATTGTRYKFNTNYITPGLNTFQLWDVSDATLQPYLQNGGTVIATPGATPYNWTEPVNNFFIDPQVSGTGFQFELIGVFTQSKLVTPLILPTVDLSDGTTVSSYIPACKTRGIKPQIRTGGAGSYRNDTALVSALQGFVAEGSIEAYDGAWNRWPNGSISDKQFELDVLQQKTWMLNNSLANPGDKLYSGAGNTLPNRKARQRAAWMGGFRVMKGSMRLSNVVAPHGFDEPTNLYTHGSGSYSGMLGQIKAHEKIGGMGISFTHAFPTYGSTPIPDANPSGNQYLENANALMDYLLANTGAGKIKSGTMAEVSTFLLGE